MVQKTQVVDLTRGFEVMNPNSYPDNLINTRKQDGEEMARPVIPFDGYNFLPTPYGYKSYFGQSSKLGIAQITSRVQQIIPLSTDTGKKYLIALCEDGIKALETTNPAATWSTLATIAFSGAVYREWTYCLLENNLYCYAAGLSLVYKLSLTNTVTISSYTPSFLNMAGQMGIFRAGSRLGFWDSANSISWSSNVDYTDFTPSLEYLAGNCIFADIVGRIVIVKESGDGFIVYATGSIIEVYFTQSSDLVWASEILVTGGGIGNPRSVCVVDTTKDQVAYTSVGIIKISMSGTSKRSVAAPIMPDVYDIFKMDRLPVYLDCVDARYIFFQTFSTRYLFGSSSFNNVVVNPTKTAVRLADGYWDGDITVLPVVIPGNTIRVLVEQWMVDNPPRKEEWIRTWHEQWSEVLSEAWTETYTESWKDEWIDSGSETIKYGELKYYPGHDFTTWTTETIINTEVKDHWKQVTKNRFKFLNNIPKDAHERIVRDLGVPPDLPWTFSGETYTGYSAPPFKKPILTSTNIGGKYEWGMDRVVVLGIGMAMWYTRIYEDYAAVESWVYFRWVMTKAPKQEGGDGYYTEPEPGEWREDMMVHHFVIAGPGEVVDEFYDIMLAAWIPPKFIHWEELIRDIKTIQRPVTVHEDGYVVDTRGTATYTWYNTFSVNYEKVTTIFHGPDIMYFDNYGSETTTVIIDGSSSGEDVSITLEGSDTILIPGYTLYGDYHLPVDYEFIMPGSEYTLQQGTPLLGYNELHGAYVYDVRLNKWGKMAGDYMALAPLTPLNSSNSMEPSITNLGMFAGVLKADGYVYIFDHKPAEGFIRYGKLGYDRISDTHLLEARVDFREYCSGTITINSSLHGKYIDPAVESIYTYTDALSCRMYPNMRAQWYTIKISGNYDLQYMEIRGNISSRR